MKSGISPIITFNTDSIQNGGNKVSDIFNDLVVPNWSLYQPIKMMGGGNKSVNNDIKNDKYIIIYGTNYINKS